MTKNFFNKLLAFVVFPGLLFAAAASPFNCSCSLAKDAGVFKSDNFGASWQQKVKISDKKNIANVDVLSLAIDAANPNNIFIGTDGKGIYKTTNSGELWEQVSDKNKILQNNAVVYDIKINSFKAGLIYAAVYQNDHGLVLRSHDNGESWEEIYKVSKQKLAVQTIEIDKTNDAIVYLGTADGGVMKSVNFGSSWQNLKWFSGPILEIKIDPANDQIIYAVGQKDGLQKSTDQGQNWQAVTINATSSSNAFSQYYAGSSSGVTSLIINQKDSNNLYYISQKGFFVSYDAGQNWRMLNILMPSNSAPILAIAQDWQSPNIIYYSVGSTVYRSDDGGATWTVNQVPSTKNVKLIKIDPLNSGIVWVGMHS